MKSLSLLLFLAFALAVQAQVIQFAISPSRGPPTPGFAISNNGNMTEGMYAFERWYNQSGRPLIEADGRNYTLSLKVITNNYTTASIRSAYTRLANTTDPTFFFAPFGSQQTQDAAFITEARQQMLVSSTAASSVWNTGYRYAFSTWPTFTSRIASVVPFLRIFKIKTAAIVRPPPTTAGIVGEICNGLESQLREVAVEPTTYTYFYTATLNQTSIDSIKQVAAEVSKLNFEAVIMCGSSVEPSELLATTFKELDWTPKIAFSATDNPWTTPNSEYWIVADTYSDRNQFPQDKYFGNAELFRALDRSTSISPAVVSHPISLFTAHAALLVYNAIKAAKSTNPVVVADVFRRATTDTFLGRFSFDAYNAQLLQGTLNQIINGSTVNIAPLSIQDAEIVFPMPTWRERTLVRQWTGVEIAAVIVIVFSLSNTIFWIVWTILNRRDRSLIAAAPVFLGGMLTGSIFIYIAMFLSIPAILSTGLCGARIWILVIGTTLLMGSLLAKTWRVWTLFSNESMTVFKISDLAVAGVLGGLLVPDIILMIIYQVVAQPRLELIVVDQFRISRNYYDCVSNPTGSIILWVIFGFHMVTFVVGAYLAWQVRLIPFKIYDESKSIAFSIYNVGFFGIILAVILNVTQAPQYVMFGLLVFICVIGSLITINVLFGSKLYWVRNGFETSSTSGTNSSSRNTGSKGSGGYKSNMGPMSSNGTGGGKHQMTTLESAQKIERLEKRVKKLKRELKIYRERDRQAYNGEAAKSEPEESESQIVADTKAKPKTTNPQPSKSSTSTSSSSSKSSSSS